ncbi:glycosyltransferase family 2 protein [Helicobacter brantae]|uniref:Beta-1,4-N-acetylgalactosamyltransferase n=1 Tax=Helicobacter brantae TaxID=375927 RepID=A0A3D8J0B2_9HELI|nr:glycosyltransferase family 2 protein [Helicobacter brantae]RDU70969.1 beta-1,4-N-acetylgalactosamyltransferase [Helicobacter brantae]
MEQKRELIVNPFYSDLHLGLDYYILSLHKKAKRLWKRGIYTNAYHPQSPLNPWAFIRVCNEAETLRQSLESIIGAISRGIIVYNECTDGSEEIIKEFCSKYQGFKCVEFPHSVAQCRCTQEEFESKKTLADYYNFALSFIPQGEWLVKIDCDQIYDAQKLKESFALATKPTDIVFYFRMNLHCFDYEIYLDKNSPILDPKDHWLICNNGLSFDNAIQESDEKGVYYWELLQIPCEYCEINAPLNTWHFPLLKASRKSLASKYNHIPLSDYKEVIPTRFLKRIAPDMLDEKRILRLLKGE